MNIFQKAITPDMPRVLEGEQIYVYVPQATSTNAGIASYKNADFKVNDGVVSLRWPAEYFVQKVPQNLTDAEKQQARENIGAGSLAVVEQSNQNSSAALKAANNALSNSTNAINLANNALSKSADATNIANIALNNSTEATNIANNALSNSVEATNIANTALSNSTEAINASNEARASAYDAFETSNIAKQNSVNAIQTAQESNTISAEAKIIAQNALDLITEGVGTQVLVNGASVATFNADTKADVTYVNQKIDEIMGPGSTEAIDTILELAEAFKTNSDIIKVLNTSISTKADKSEIPTEYIKSASVSADGKTLTITPLIGNSISFKGGIELPTNLVTTDTTQTIVATKTFTSQTNFTNVVQLNSESNVGGETSRIIFYNPNVNLADPNPSATQVLGQISSAINGGGYASKLLTYRNSSGTVVWSLDLRNNSGADGVYDYNNDKYKSPIIASLSKVGTPTINLNGLTTNTSSNFVVKKGSDWSQFTAYSASNYYRAFEADDSRIRLDVRDTNSTESRRFVDIDSRSANVDNSTAIRIVTQGEGAATDYVATHKWVNDKNYVPSSTASREFAALIPKNGTVINNGANLNSVAYLKVGNYYQGSTDSTSKMTNIPMKEAFMMTVYSPLSSTYDNETTSAWCYRTRCFMTLAGDRWWQYCYTTGTAGVWTYGSWNREIHGNGGEITGELKVSGSINLIV